MVMKLEAIIKEKNKKNTSALFLTVLHIQLGNNCF